MADDPIALLRALVEAGSVNPPGATTGPARVARAWLEARGLRSETVAADPAKPNLILRLGNGAGPHVVLNAHLDTVPPGDRAAWSVEPFALTEREGRLHGLGTGNMKAAAAAMMRAMADLAARRDWAGAVTLTLVADECVFGPDGAAHLLATRPDLRGDHLICGEGPGGMALAVAEKGLLWSRLEAEGPVGQGMLTRAGGSATARLARVLVALDEWNDERVAPPLPSLDHAANAEGMRLSVNAGRIGGGGFVSQAASEAWAEVDMRLPPGLTVEAVEARMDALCARVGGVRRIRIKGWDANWTDPQAPVAHAVRAAAGGPRDVTRLPASDASRWRALGVPAVCFGPQPGLASGVDDHVLRADYLRCAAIYAEAVRALLHTAE
jgi:succinyl-diaminopimelate desuccinylase